MENEILPRLLNISYNDHITNDACAIRYMEPSVFTKISYKQRRKGKYDGLDVW